MIKFWNLNSCIYPIDSWQSGCWVQVTKPDKDDLAYLVNILGVPDSFLSDIADMDERARYDSDEGWAFINLRIPNARESVSVAPYNTVPLAILFKGDKLVTICYEKTQMMKDFAAHHIKRAKGFIDVVDFILRLFLSSAVWYLNYLKAVSIKIEEAKFSLTDKKINNSDLIGLSRLQDSLTYFATAIRGNETLLSKLRYKLSVDELDKDLIEDVNVEMEQARETTSIYISILNSTMETNANIINNDMNAIMKVLTSLSMIIMFPTLIASLFGMNLINGMEEWTWGFPFALVLCLLSTVLSYLWLKGKGWM